MASLSPESQVSLDDILEYTSNNEELNPEEQAEQLQELPEFVPDTSQQTIPDLPVLAPFQGYHPNTDIYAIDKHELSRRAGSGYVPLQPPTAEMLFQAAQPEISEQIPQDHPEWQNLRSGRKHAWQVCCSLMAEASTQCRRHASCLCCAAELTFKHHMMDSQHMKIWCKSC